MQVFPQIANSAKAVKCSKLVRNQQTSNFIWFMIDHFGWCISGVLWAGYFPSWLNHVTRQAVNAYGWTGCKLTYFCWYFFRQYSSALLVMMSVEKCIALYFPFKTRNVCTVKTAKWASGIACVIFILFNSFWFFVVKIEKGKFLTRNIICIFEDYFMKHFLAFMQWIDWSSLLFWSLCYYGFNKHCHYIQIC